MTRWPRPALWSLLIAMAGTFAAELFSDPRHSFGGPALRIIVLCGSGALFVSAAVLLVLQRRTRRGPPTR